MRVVRVAALLMVLGQGTFASAAPMAVRHGRSIRVTIGGRTEDAVALRPTPAGWRLELGGAPEGATVSVRDVTLGASATPRYELNFVAGGLVLDTARFRADHAYRIEVRRGTVIIGGALIYLSPPRASSRVVFDDRDRNGGDDDGLAPTVDKGAL